ncbi:MAG TPA: hypothetical protein VGB91_06070 [Rhizomicrobium sp.]
MARRYLVWFLLTVSLAMLAVVGFNAVADRIILETANGPSVETVPGFERVLKPAWLATVRPDLVFVGSSRIRDGFDPVLVDPVLRVHSFNYGVSSITAYEARRFAQDAAAQPSVKTIVLSLDSFSGDDRAQPFAAGFDETRLAVSADGAPTPRRDLWLFTTRYLSGGALGMHALGLYLLAQLGPHRTAADRPDLFNAYSHMTADFRTHDLKFRRARAMRLLPWEHGQFRALLQGLCGRDLRLIAFFPPDRAEIAAIYAANDAAGLRAFKEAIAADARRHDATCRSKIAVLDFLIRSPLTTEPLTNGVSESYVDLVHVRPPTGLRLLRAMLGSDRDGLGRVLVSGR